jgi:predicted flap endonuclease-1-like 5' DNA nuclease
MKWFLIQSIFLAALAFGLGALFHRLTWRKTSGVTTSTSSDVNRFGATGGSAAQVAAKSGDVDARAAELTTLRAEHAKVTAERDAKAKELSALSFEHSAAKTSLTERDASLATLRGEVEKAKAGTTAAASTQIQGLTGQIDDHKAQIVTLDGKLKAATADNDAALATLRTDYEGRLTALRAEHTNAIAALKLDQDGALGKAKGDLDTRVSALTSEHGSAIVSLRADHDRAVQEVHGERDRALSGLRSDHEKALADLRRRSETAEAELAKVRADCDGHTAELAKVRSDLDARHGEIRTLTSTLDATKARVVDDLEVIEGIGPAMAKALNADGIRTFEALASSDEAQLRAAVEKAGHKFAPSIPTWSKQARYLVDGDQEGFKAYTEYLIAGVDPAGLTTEAGNDGHYGSGQVQAFAAGSADPGSDDAYEGVDVVADDLLRIEGVGPKINEILLGGGIRTFRRLAAVPEDSVRAIVNAGGVSFIPSVGTWAAQAALLRDGDEAGFQALVDKLVAGRDDSR